MSRSTVTSASTSIVKMGKLPSGEHVLIYLTVPKGKTIVQTPYMSTWRGQDPRSPKVPLVRFGEYTVARIVHVNRPTVFEMAAQSFRNPRVIYKVGQKYSVKLDTTAASGHGCHGFVCPDGEAVVRLWPAMFGATA